LLRPSQEAFEELATRGNLVPVVRELLVDMDTPVSLFRKLDDGNTSFLFESVEGGEKWGRYSFIGRGARAIFRARGRDVEWTANGETRRVRVPGDPLEYLRRELALLEPVHLDGVELPPGVFSPPPVDHRRRRAGVAQPGILPTSWNAITRP